MRSALALLLLVTACEKAGGGGVHATRAQCDAYVAAIDAWNVELDRDAESQPTEGHWHRKTVFVGAGFAETCPERMTAKQVDCMIDHARRHDMHPECKPEVDLRPADARHTPAECERYVAKTRELAAAAPSHFGQTPTQQSDIAARGASSECNGWLSRARYECVLAATTDDARRACPL